MLSAGIDVRSVPRAAVNLPARGRDHVRFVPRKVTTDAAGERGVSAWGKRKTMGMGRPALGADHVELDVDIVTRGVRVGADLFVRLLDQVRELSLLQALVLDTHLHGKTEAAAVARADRDGAGDLSVGRVLFVLLGNEVNRAAETSGIACSEEMLWRRGSRLTRTAHLLGTDRSNETMPSLDWVWPLRRHLRMTSTAAFVAQQRKAGSNDQQTE